MNPPVDPPLRLLDAGDADVVLVVDDVPDNLAVLHDALDESGYTVLVATRGEQALERARQAQPDLVLLDAVMPGMDGFEVARRLKADPVTAHIPIVFMTGLTDAEHVVEAFAAGGIDYVTKPLRPREVLARIAAHLRSARAQQQAKQALDAFGHATLVMRQRDGRRIWQTALARQLMARHFPDLPDGELPPEVLAWAPQAAAAEPGAATLNLSGAGGRLSVALHPMGGDEPGEGEWLLVLRESSEAALMQSLAQGFPQLTARECEVLYWVVQGKTNRDIGDILGNSPRTVHKHLEHVFEKLGVETRTAAAAMALARARRGA